VVPVHARADAAVQSRGREASADWCDLPGPGTMALVRWRRCRRHRIRHRL